MKIAGAIEQTLFDDIGYGDVFIASVYSGKGLKSSICLKGFFEKKDESNKYSCKMG